MAKQQAADSRWITVRETYNHYWPSRAVTHYTPGEYRVKNEVADGAIAKGKATEGRADGSEATAAKKPKHSRKTSTKRRAKVAGNAEASDTGTVAAMGDTGVSDADRPADRPPVDSDAG